MLRAVWKQSLKHSYALTSDVPPLPSPAASSPPVVCVPLLLPLLTLMERPSITPEGAELWETSDQSCDIMLRHLEAARAVADDAQSYTANTQRILQG